MVAHFGIGTAGAGSGCAKCDAMIPPGARVWLAMGHTDMRRGMQSLPVCLPSDRDA